MKCLFKKIITSIVISKYEELVKMFFQIVYGNYTGDDPFPL